MATRTDNHDPQTDAPENDDQLLNWAFYLVEDGRANRRGHEALWWENIATFVGDFWSEWDPISLKLKETKKPNHKVRIPVNLAQPVVRTELAKLTKNKPITDVVAASNDKGDLNAAKVGDKILANYAEKKFSLPKVRRRCLHWVLMCGYGGTFVDYDETAEAPIEVYQAADGNPVFDMRQIEIYKAYYKKQGKSPKKLNIPQGELKIKAVSPFQLLWDRAQTDIEDAWWVIVSDAMDVIEVERRWNTVIEGENDALPGVLEQRMLAKFDRTGKLTMDPPKAQKLAEVHRLFVKPGHPFFPDGLHLVFTKSEIIHQENFPFGHGELPVSCMGHVPLPVSQYALSVLQQVRPIALEISRTISQLVENRNLMANPPWRIARQIKLGKDEELVNKPGLRLTYTHLPNVPPPEPIQMPEIPQYVKDLVPMMKEVVLEISGQGETSQGKVPAGARSGVAIAYLQEEDDTRLGPTVQEFEEMIERVSSQILETIAENYDVPRTIQIYKKNSEPEVFDFVGTMLEGNTTVVVQAGSALPRSKAAKQQYILDLWDRKLEQDPRRVRTMLELSEGEPDEFEIDLDQAERENRKMAQGETVPVLEWYNHAAHHLVHRRFMKSPDFEALDEGQQQIYLDHDEEHTRFEEDQAAKAAAAAQGGGGGPPPPPSRNGGPPTGPADVAPGAEGQQRPEGPPAQFASEPNPRSLLDAGPQ